MPSVGFEHAIPAIKRTQSYTSDRGATAIRVISRQRRGNAKYWKYRILKFQILIDNFWYHHHRRHHHHHHHHHHASLLLRLLFRLFHGIRILDCPAVEFILRQFLFQQIWTFFYCCIFTGYLHKIVTLARFGIGSLMMVQMDRNM